MIRRILRLFGLLLLIAAFAAVLHDGARAIGSGNVILLTGAEAWGLVSPGGWEAAAARLRDWPAGWLWEPVAAALLALPAVVTTGVAGALLTLAGRPRSPIGRRR